jgi:Spy/CpxP family protein refolding chaperone
MKDVKKTRMMLTMVMVLMIMAPYANAQHRNHGEKQRGGDGFEARPGYQQRGLDMLDLSEDQKTKIEDIRLQFEKNQIQSSNQIREKQAQLRTLLTQDNVDKTKVFGLIDDIGNLRTEGWKARTEAHIKIRSLLTDKQKVQFDQHPGGSFGPRGHGYERGLK